jgi:hypothetical protein
MASMAASFDEKVALMSVPSQCLMGDRWKVDLSRLLPMLSPGTWAASSKFIGELEHHQGLVVFDIQTSKPFEAWLNADKSRREKADGGFIRVLMYDRLLLEKDSIFREGLMAVRLFDRLDETGNILTLLSRELFAVIDQYPLSSSICVLQRSILG